MNLIPYFIRRRIAHRPYLLKVVDNIGWLFFDKILRMGVGLVVGVWIARYLGPQQFGQLSFAVAFTALFGAIAGLGLHSIVVRDIVRDPTGKEEVLGTAAMLQFVGGLVAYGVVLGAIFWLRPTDTMAKTLVAILGSIMLFRASDVALYWFESQVLSKYIVWIQNGSLLVFAAIKIMLIVREAPLITFAWLILFEALAVSILTLVMLGLRGLRLREMRFTLARAKGLLTDSWPLLLSGVAITIYMKIDQIMLGQMVGDEAVGIYSAAVRLSELWYFVPIMIVASVFPAILETKKRNEIQYLKRIQYLYDVVIWLAIGIAITMTFIAEFVVTLLYGEAYKGASEVLIIHIWAGLFVSMGVARGPWLLSENLQHMSYRYIGLALVTNVVGNYYAIPCFGVKGAATTTLISQAVSAVIAPALFKETRVSSQMFFSSLSPVHLYRLVRVYK